MLDLIQKLNVMHLLPVPRMPGQKHVIEKTIEQDKSKISVKIKFYFMVRGNNSGDLYWQEITENEWRME